MDAAAEKAGERTQREQEIWAGFHRAWTECVGTPDYVKAEWMKVERQLYLAMRKGENADRIN